MKLKCDICENKFKTTILFRLHMRIAHNFEEHQCNICHKIFQSKKKILQHSRRVHEKPKDYKCIRCRKTFTRAILLKHHNVSVHAAILRAPKSKSDYCDKSFLVASYLEHHINKVHEGQKDKCNLCGKLFHNVWSLVSPRHMDTKGLRVTKNASFLLLMHTYQETFLSDIF